MEEGSPTAENASSSSAPDAISQKPLPKVLTTIRTARPQPQPEPEPEPEPMADNNQEVVDAQHEVTVEEVESHSDPGIEVATEIIASLTEVLPEALEKGESADMSAGDMPCHQDLYQVLEVSQAEAAVAESEEQAADTMANSLGLPALPHSPKILSEEVRRQNFWTRIREVMSSRNSDILLREKVDRIKNVLLCEGKGVLEPSRFIFYIRHRQFSLKSAPELGWNEEVCEPTKEEDASDNSLLGNWRRVAAAEDIFDILKEIHEEHAPHKNYRHTYLAVAKKWARIPRHICKEFVYTCPKCILQKEKFGIGLNEDGTPKRPLKRRVVSPATPIRNPKMCKVSLEDFKLKGLIAAPFTPFAENGDVDLKCISRYVDLLLEDGVDNVFVLGTTGEGPSLTMKERKAVASEWVKCARKRIDHVIVQVGTGNLKDTQELALHALSIGASAIAVLPPVYYSPQTPEHLVNYLKQVGSIVPQMPMLFYHYPKKTGFNFTMMDILRALELDPIPNFKGAKFVTPDLTDFSLSVNVAKDKYQMIYSRDGMVLPSMTLGGEAYVGSTFNFAGKVFARMIEAFHQGDLERARAEQFRMHAFLDVMNRYEKVSGAATLKYTMALARLDVGPPRPPLSQMCQEDFQALRKDLTEIGFFDWIN